MANPPRARLPFFALLAVISFGLLGNLDADTRAPGASAVRGTAYVGRGLSAENLVVFGATIAGGDPSGVLLIDGPDALKANRSFLDTFHPPRIVPVGSFPESDAERVRLLGAGVERVRNWSLGPPRQLWNDLFPTAPVVVVCPARPRALLLHAACLAGELGAPLFVSHGLAPETRELNQHLARWQTKHVYAVGGTYPRGKHLPGVEVTRLAHERDVVSLYLARLARGGPVRTLVVANPADTKDGQPALSSLAPWVALKRRAALLLTDEAGEVDKLVTAALKQKALRRADTLLIVADLKAVPMKQRPNPIAADHDEKIDMEPLTPTGTDPFSFSVGRVFHNDIGVAALLLARQHLLERKTGTPRVLVASNPGSSLPLLETFSRQTVRELRNCGYETTVLFGAKLTEEALRKELPKHDLFLWEGHHNTLIRDWSFPQWEGPLPPSFLFLQSCLALMEHKVHPALSRGALGVIGTSTRTYSASGGACSLCFFNGMLYEDLTVGESLRHAKNFLLAYILLKEKRLGKDAKRTGANLRAAWAFTLWGDPTLRLPAPGKQTPEIPPVRHRVKGNTITLSLPPERHDKVQSGRYQAQALPNGSLAGLLKKEKGDDGRPLVPLVFAEIPLPKAPEGMVPQLHSRLPSRNWVFNWDARRRCGYLLAVPRTHENEELRFRVSWAASQSVEQSAETAGSGQ
ncbi:MAG: hypothetical protein HYS12_04645 [Planctomycetes bacterium]|nr:hypothetical protein [Planctomycetota bacterium]